MAEEYEIEEGEIYDDSHIGLAYIDVKIQSILSDYMNDFEGGVSIENLGPKFGVYGTFLTSYQLPLHKNLKISLPLHVFLLTNPLSFL